MKKKLAIIILTIAALAAIIYGEYRYIMTHISVYIGSNGNVYLEVFDQVDEYDPTEDNFDCSCGACK